MTQSIIPIVPYQRKYLKQNTNYDSWSKLEDFANELINQEIDSTEELLEWLHKKNELDVIVNQQAEWNDLESYRYSGNEEKKQKSESFNKNVLEKYNLISGTLNKMILENTHFENLIKTRPEFQPYFSQLQKQNKGNGTNNGEVSGSINVLINDYNKISSQQKIKVGDNEIPIFRAASISKTETASKRKEISKLIEQKQAEDADKIDAIFDKMIKLRHQLAEQAGYKNYRDYIWDKKSRIDYAPKDCSDISIAIKDHFIPIHKNIIAKRKTYLNQDKIYLCDLQVEMGTAPAPNLFYKSSEEFIEKLIEIFRQINPEFGKLLSYMQQQGRLDLEDRPKKIPAMFSTYLPESRLPFSYYIPLNRLADIHNCIHEITHAFHSIYCNHLDLEILKNPNAESSELFTLSMELISMDKWIVFLDDKQNLIRAKLKKLEHCLATFRMVALWDSFQHWVYLNPAHTHSERNLYWDELSSQFDIGISTVIEQPSELNSGWQLRPLIFRAPFYMIEYAFAQLGACEIYRQYKSNPDQTIKRLVEAMKLGNTRSLKEVYRTAGVEFDFSNEYISKIANFIKKEYDDLFAQLEQA